MPDADGTTDAFAVVLFLPLLLLPFQVDVADDLVKDVADERVCQITVNAGHGCLDSNEKRTSTPATASPRLYTIKIL